MRHYLAQIEIEIRLSFSDSLAHNFWCISATRMHEPINEVSWLWDSRELGDNNEKFILHPRSQNASGPTKGYIHICIYLSIYDYYMYELAVVVVAALADIGISGSQLLVGCDLIRVESVLVSSGLIWMANWDWYRSDTRFAIDPYLRTKSRDWSSGNQRDPRSWTKRLKTTDSRAKEIQFVTLLALSSCNLNWFAGQRIKFLSCNGD